MCVCLCACVLVVSVCLCVCLCARACVCVHAHFIDNKCGRKCYTIMTSSLVYCGLLVDEV